jgi:hypothetical protein
MMNIVPSCAFFVTLKNLRSPFAFVFWTGNAPVSWSEKSVEQNLKPSASTLTNFSYLASVQWNEARNFGDKYTACSLSFGFAI